MAIQREAIIQKHARLWAREALACDSEFFAFDRANPTSQWQHMHEKMRGVKAGTPDTLLRVKDRRNIWCEFKSPGNKPSDVQLAIGARLIALGDDWGWCASVNEYRLYLTGLDIAMHPNAQFLALHHDVSVMSEITKAEAKAGYMPRTAVKRRVAAKDTQRSLAAMRKAGVLV